MWPNPQETSLIENFIFCAVKKSTNTLIFLAPFHSSKLVYFIESWFGEKEILSFEPQKIYFVFLKQ